MPELSSLPKYYTTLVGHVDGAIAALDHGDEVKAKALLIEGLGKAEEIYIEMTADEDGESDVPSWLPSPMEHLPYLY